MNEHPIAFSGEMVRAILDGRKTQTRRVIKNSPCTCGNPPGVSDCKLQNIGANQWVCSSFSYTGDFVACTYGQIGDHLWVRETWQTHCDMDNVSPSALPVDTAIQYPATYDHWVSKKRPSIFLPRWASRITLEITNIRVERLQDISEEDSKAEGIEVPLGLKMLGEFYKQEGKTHRVAFKSLWEKINGKKYPWDSNPYVWVIEFTKI